MLLSPLTLLLGIATIASHARANAADPASSNTDIYEESLVFRPLADGKLSVLFRFHTKAHDGTLLCHLLVPLILMKWYRSSGAS